MAITPGAASRMKSTTAFFEEALEQGRRLAKMNVLRPNCGCLREFDTLAAAKFEGKFAPAREQSRGLQVYAAPVT